MINIALTIRKTKNEGKLMITIISSLRFNPCNNTGIKTIGASMINNNSSQGDLKIIEKAGIRNKYIIEAIIESQVITAIM